MEKQMKLFTNMTKPLVLFVLLFAFGVGEMWGSNAHHCLIGEPITTWKSTDNWSKSYEQFALTSPANSNWDEFCAYMWIETDQTFAFNNHFFNPGEAKQVGPGTDKATLYNNAGTGQGVATDGTTNAYQYTGSTGLVKVCAAQSSGSNNQGEWKPYVWVEESKEIEILKGNKIMFYFGMTTDWNEDWNVLRTENTSDKTADQQYHRLPESKCSSWISVAYVSPARYYVGKTGWAGVQMEAVAEAGCLYSVYKDGSDKIYKNVGHVPHFSTTTVSKVQGTTDSEIEATAENSIYGNEQLIFYYYTTDGGTTFTQFDPSDISSLGVGIYTVYALGWDGHIMVKSDNSVTLNVGVTISLSANGGTDGAVTSVLATPGVAASTGNIAVGSLPSRLGYTFNGFWTTNSGGTQVINSDGTWKSNISDYTDSDGKWTCTSASTLYAKWTAKDYIINLANMEADKDHEGTESVTVTFDASTNMTASDPIIKPTKTHYDFAGYWTSENTGATLDHQLIGADGKWIKDVEGYTSYDGSGNPTWVHDYPISLYAKWTEHEYAITIAVTGSGSTSPASSTTAKYVTASGDITATPSTGYWFREWGFSKTDEKYDVYVSDDKTYSSTDATIKINAQHNGTLTANFTPHTYTVRFENLGADAGHKGSLDTTVTFNDTINMKGGIEVPSKTNYDFGGYYISTDKGATLTNTQIIDANGNWKKGISGYTGTKDGVASWVCAGDTVLYAKWTEDKHTVSVAVSPAGAGSVQVNSSNVTSVSGVGIATQSAEMTPIALAGWKFKEWQVTSNLQMDLVNYHSDYKSGTANKMRINATDDDQTITAVFEPRYYLVGGEIMSEDDDTGTGTSSGMPGWDNYYKPFKVVTTSPVLDTCKLTLGTNKNFYIMVRDKADGLSYGTSSSISWDTQSALFDTRDVRATFQSNGGTEYTFKITAIDGSGRPTVSVERPYQVNLGWQYKTLDADATSGNTGGTAAMSKTSGGDAVSNGAWVPYGTGVTYTASPTTGYSVAWYSSSDYSGDSFTTDAVFYHTATSTGNGYAKFTEKTTTVSLENDGHGKVQIGGVDKTGTTCGVTTTRSLTAVPNTGYAFKDWSKPSGDDITLSSTTTNPTTLTGVGSGLSEGQRVYASFSEIARTITASAGTGGSVGATNYTAYIDTKTDISATPATGYKFKEWKETGGTNYVTFDNPNSASTKIKATANATIQAVFEPRWAIAGSWKTYPESTAWDADTYKLDNIGKNGSSKDTCYVEITLRANTDLTFKIVDRGADGTVAVGSYVDYGNNTVATQYMKYNNHTNWDFHKKNSTYWDCGITTTGGGTYRFAFNITDTTLTVIYPASYQSNFGWKYADGAGTLHDGDNGGTITVTASDGGSHTISSGQWVAAGASITYLASPAAGYGFAGWHANSDCSTDKFNDEISWTDSPLGSTSNSYAKFVPVALTFTNNGGSGDGKWNTASNWSPACVPTIDHDVTIQAPVTVNIAHATAKSIVLDQNSNTGNLTIEANKGLEVVGTITRTTDGSDRLATREEDLVLESDEDGNASLIFNNSNSCAATVQMYSKATIVGNTWNWQYVGTPFTGSIPQYNYFGSWMYKWNNGWEVVHGGDELTPFAGYCLTQNSATTHVMGGTLVSTTSKSVTMAASTDMVLANSWTAPIWIGGFTASTFTSAPATIYLFNTGSAENGSSAGTEAGTYETVTVNAAEYLGTEFIAPMQGFFVTTNGVGGAAGSITLNYNDLVRPAGKHTGIVAGPMKVRKQEETKPDVMKIRANGALYNDRVVILAREDFSEGFDNGWDGEKMSFGEVAPSVYVINEQGGYDAVSAIPSFEGTVVGFRAGTNNSCTMTFEYDGEEIWYLNDLQTQQSTLIDSELTYTFSTSSYDNEARFIISATPIRKITTGNESVGAEAAKVRKLIINDKLYIIRGGRMYSVDGAMIK